MNDSEINFLLAARCWVYPFCYLPPSEEKCFRIAASGLNCGECAFQVRDEKRARELNRVYEQRMREREKKHYEFIKSKKWKNEARPRIVKHDNYQCAVCMEKVEMKNAHVHHIIDYSSDEDLSPHNLVTLCNRCHSKLHPVFPNGMWALGWPDNDKVKERLRHFYGEVKEASRKNTDRFAAPLEHLMMHLCLLCSLFAECEIGKSTRIEISKTMDAFQALLRTRAKRYFIAELHEGAKNCIVEGKIVSMREPKEVDTRYGKTSLVVARLRDETGEIALNLFGEQATEVNEGDTLAIENAYTMQYEGVLTLNIPKGKGIIRTKTQKPSLTGSGKNMEEHPYNRSAVSKLEGSFHKGAFSEISILKICKNHRYSCPKSCLYYGARMADCRYKKPLMNKPIEDELLCTIVLANIKSSLSPSTGTLMVESGARVLDSKGRSYRGHTPYLCEELHSLAKQEFGYISRGEFDRICIYEGTEETILFPFPEMPEKEEIRGFILTLRCTKSGINKSLETYDFRLIPPKAEGKSNA